VDGDAPGAGQAAAPAAPKPFVVSRPSTDMPEVAR